jgi:hypothetical protein
LTLLRAVFRDSTSKSEADIREEQGKINPCTYRRTIRDAATMTSERGLPARIALYTTHPQKFVFADGICGLEARAPT